MKYGLIGKTLKHSYSKIIHQQFFGYDYELIELDSLDEFFLKKDFCGINVTFPYKEDVIKFCDKLDSSAIEVGCVNVITNRNGLLTGYNTDYFGLKFTFEKNNIDILGKKALILGSGGTSKTASCVLKNCHTNIVSRTPQKNMISYKQAYSLIDTNIIVNTTPVGMFEDKSPINLSCFKSLDAVVDVIYNPTKTKLIKDAEALNIKAINGITMLIAQAVKSAEIFTDKQIPMKEEWFNYEFNK